VWGRKGRDLPSNWSKIRLAVLKRDQQRCTYRNIYDERCKREAEEVDHIKDNDDHSMSNLRAMCHHHHALHTGQQAAEARQRNKEKVSQRLRRTEQHPGELSGETV